MSNKRKIAKLAACMLVFLAVAAVCILWLIPYATSHKEPESESDEGSISHAAESAAALLDNVGIDQMNEEAEAEVPEKLNKTDGADEPYEDTEKFIINDNIKLMDIYSESGENAVFKCYDSEAISYEWEYYDTGSKSWKAAASENLQSYEDEFHRKLSGFSVQADKSNDEVMVRCTIHFQEKEDECQTAFLYVLRDEIKDIFIEDIETNANICFSSRELPVRVTYKDGTDEVLTGLNHLYFITTEEKEEHSTTISGNRIDAVTQITTERDQLYIGLEEKEVSVRYRSASSKPEDMIETSVILKGKDLTAPVISEVSISPYEVSNIDKPVILTVSISAEDNETPYPSLEYAFLFSDQKPDEEDWEKKAVFDISIERNGIYTAYVRDRSGNIAKMEREIVTVDTKAPAINSVSLSDETGWCKSNTIIVTAKDKGTLTYRYECEGTGEDSGWITYNEYSAAVNGTWHIYVKDAAGNISESEIMVSNIDREAPIIKNIHVKE